jgi:hypothetical protein
MNAKQKFDQRLIGGAYRYAAANRSDPFALNQALAHIRAGICQNTPTGQPGGYDARSTMETRTLDEGMTFSDGTNTYQVEVWREVSRP